jgi:hypothetical protein
MGKDIYTNLRKAKQTLFRGIWYRSRSEAKWAYVFWALGLPAYYEPSTYKLPSGNYLPDFWLPTLESYFEVKPFDVDDTRHVELGVTRGKRVFVASGDLPTLTQWGHDDELVAMLAGHIWQKWPHEAQDIALVSEYKGRYNLMPIAVSPFISISDPRILGAYMDAGSYRFTQAEVPICPQ